ncbi:YjfK family protein [Massilia kyonggiensis]|nr:YjfK family protein [Massilia kyonggiensis]
MAWKDVFSYVRAVAANKGVTQGETRADDDVPLGARIGSVVQIQMSPIIRAQTNGSLIAMPAAADTRILAVSQIRLQPDTELYRLYLDKGDDAADEKFLQVFCGDDGKVSEVLYCTQLARVIPETADDQDAYTGVAGYGLGDAGYTLWREQLADMLGAAELATAFGESDRLDYTRDAGRPDAQFVSPFKGRETRIDDAAGMHGLRQEMYFMPYVRQLADGSREYLLITTEIVESIDGDANKRGIHVDFVIGIPMEQERIVIQ